MSNNDQIIVVKEHQNVTVIFGFWIYNVTKLSVKFWDRESQRLFTVKLQSAHPWVQTNSNKITKRVNWTEHVKLNGINKPTEVQHWGGVVAGPVVGDQIDLSLSLLLLDPQLSPAVAVSTETAEEDQHRPQQPEPCKKKKTGNEPNVRPALLLMKTNQVLISYLDFISNLLKSFHRDINSQYSALLPHVYFLNTFQLARLRITHKCSSCM